MTTSNIPVFNNVNAAQINLSFPRGEPREKRGRIQKATPIANCAIQPTNANSMCSGRSDQIVGENMTPLFASNNPPTVNPNSAWISDARTK